MSTSNDGIVGPDLTAGISLLDLSEGEPFLGHVGEEAVVVVKQRDRVFAVSAECTHYGGPLQDGVVADGQIRCPWHHAKFELLTGHAAGPAVQPLGCFSVDVDGGVVRVGGRIEHGEPREVGGPASVVIVGDGPAGAACAEKLRHLGYSGPITLLAGSEPFPVDRPNLSKDFLAGDAPKEWLPMREPAFYEEHDIHLARQRATAIDHDQKTVQLENGSTLEFGALLLATGAEPRQLDLEGADLDHVHTLRSMADAEQIIGELDGATRAVVIGASFIGLEAAASLRKRGIDVTAVDSESVPMRSTLGTELGDFVRSIHEQHGVKFELGHEPAKITSDGVTLDDGRTLPADIVIVGIGVEPRTELAESIGLLTDDGVLVDEHFQTSMPNIYAAGDIARFPLRGGAVRVEHFAMATRQGQAVAKSMLGRPNGETIVPFFWSRHFDESIAYVGHADSWDTVHVAGSLDDHDATVAYEQDGEIRAVATVGRPDVSLMAELAIGRGDQAELRQLIER